MTVKHLLSDTHVIGVISNPIRYQSRYSLFFKWHQHMIDSGVQHIHVVEVQNGERDFVVTDAQNPYHTQLRTEDELWHKENMMNIALSRLTPRWQNWKYVIFSDCDISFVNPGWLEETVQALQVHHVVQPWSHAQDLGPNNEAIGAPHNGFLYSYWNDLPIKEGYSNWHPGFAWAFTRYAINQIGGWPELAILGSGDRHLACSLIGRGSSSFNHRVHDNYRHMVMSFQDRCEQYVKRDVGYCHGMILHGWHGSKVNRQYKSRWQILVDNKYDPYKDVYRDWQGLLRLNDDKIELRHAIQKYFRQRREDSIDAPLPGER
jgi:hypothetical protein